MNNDEALARQIYALKVVLQPHWDMQQQARDSLVAAKEFAVAIREISVAASSNFPPAPTIEQPQPEPVAIPGQS